MRILLVDDEIEFVSTLADRLAMRGIPADYVTSGAEALAALAAQDYDLAVIDMKMAGMSGLETMKRLRERKPDIRCILLTGHGDEEDYYKGQEAGCSFYLMKPLDIEVLMEKIREAMKK